MLKATRKQLYPSALLYGFLALVPLIIYIVCLQQNAVNIPIWDEWQLVDFRLRAIADSVSWQDIFALHNEHRIASMRLIALATNQLSTGWQSSLRMAISCAISITAFSLLILLTWRQFKSSVDDHLTPPNWHIFGFTTVATSLFFFSPAQQENWLWGFQVPWFLIQFILIAAVFLLYEFLKSQQLVYYVAAILLCFVASFSLAQGLFVWLVCLPMFLTKGLKRKFRLAIAGTWLLAATVAFAAYMTGYSKPAGHPNTRLALERPGLAIDFFLNLVGNALGQDGISNVVLGLVMVLTFLSLVILCYRQSATVWNDALVWLSIGLFPMVFATVTTVGRLGLGSGAALASRYSTVTLLLPICLAQLFRIFLHHQHSLNKLIRPLVISTFLLGFMFAGVVDGYENGLSDARNGMHHRKEGRACLEFYAQMEPELANECIARYIFPVPSFPLEIMKTLNAEGIIAPPAVVP